jgi:hypothetical protein
MPDTITRARSVIQSRLTELDTEAAALRKALQGLGERAAPRKRRGRTKRAAAAPAKAKARPARKRKSAKGAPRPPS